MQEKILLILQDTINSQYFYYILLLSIIIVILNGIWGYRGYLKDCHIFQQKPKPIGYMKNILDNVILICILSTLAFMGYISLDYAENQPEAAIETRYIKNSLANEIIKKDTTTTKEIKDHRPIKMTIMETSQQQKKIASLRHQLKASQKRENYYRKQMELYKKRFKEVKEKQAKSQKSDETCKKKEIVYMRNGKVFKKERNCI